MSAYSETRTTFKDAALLLEALKEMGYGEVECHIGNPQQLVGYHGDLRADKADIIIRRKHIGSASNDIGFRRGADGTYGAIISDYDSHKHNAQWTAKLRNSYADKGIMRQAKRAGLRFTGKKLVANKMKYEFVKA
jgi:hypothetical protein